MENKGKFNQSEYVQSYMKTHYKEIKLRVKFDLAEAIEAYCLKHDKSKQGLILDAVKKYIDYEEE